MIRTGRLEQRRDYQKSDMVIVDDEIERSALTRSVNAPDTRGVGILTESRGWAGARHSRVRDVETRDGRAPTGTSTAILFILPTTLSTSSL